MAVSDNFDSYAARRVIIYKTSGHNRDSQGRNKADYPIQ